MVAICFQFPFSFIQMQILKIRVISLKFYYILDFKIFRLNVKRRPPKLAPNISHRALFFLPLLCVISGEFCKYEQYNPYRLPRISPFAFVRYYL